MKAWQLGAVAVAALGSTVGCGGPVDGPVDPETGSSKEALELSYTRATISPTLAPITTTKATFDRSITRHRADPRFSEVSAFSAPLAALGTLTIDCLGTIGPKAYDVVFDERLGYEILVPNFQECKVEGAKYVFRDITRLLAFQRYEGNAFFTEKGEPVARELWTLGAGQRFAEYAVQHWIEWAKNFQRDPEACPEWRKIGENNPPDPETSGATVSSAYVGKSDSVYEVKSQYCGDAACNVEMAYSCAGGFGPTLFVSSDREKSIMTLDPVYWWNTTPYTDPATDPFDYPYYHKMSTYGGAPGDLWGALERQAEECTRYEGGYHRRNRFLYPVMCGGVVCMAECMDPALAPLATAVVDASDSL